MACFRALVRVFVRDYIARYEHSPSYGEIAAHFDCSKRRAKDAVLSLANSGLLVRVPGPRGLRMPEEQDEAIRKLRELGWEVDEADQRVRGPDSTLLPPAALDYPPAGDDTSKGDNPETPEDR